MTFPNLTRSGGVPADISALADGSIPANRRDQIVRRIEASEELRAAFDQERAAVEILHRARLSERAPDSLRRRVAQERPARPAHRRPLALRSSLAAATAVALGAAALLLTGSPTNGPSVAQAASLAVRGSLIPGPRVNPVDPTALLAGVGAAYFPNWSSTLGWSVVGQRVDRLARHTAVTVYYERHGLDVAYTIVSVPGLQQPRARVVTTAGLRLRVLLLAGREVVTWRRDGQTCVLSSRKVPAQRLESMAAWS